MPQLGSTKSRKGCKRCKQRRVKCDEQVPCGGCTKRNEECSFLAPSPTESETSIDKEDWVLDLELMHHYTTVLYGLGAREEVVHLWRYYIPQQAFENPFLMHGLLAFSALHLAYLRPDSSTKYLRQCDKHQAIAIESFRSVLSSQVDPKHADALFAVSAVLSLSSMARSCALSEIETIDMDCVVELFMLTRGIGNMIRLSSEHIRKGPMAIMLEHKGCPGNDVVQLPPSITSRFEALRDMLLTYGLDPEALAECKTALMELEGIYRILTLYSPTATIDVGDISRWQVAVPMGYLRLLRTHCAPALVILGFYAAAITAIHTAWYTHNWSEYVLRGISQALDEDMQHWLEWPWRQVKEGMSELGVRSPSDSGNLDPLIIGTDQLCM